MLFYNLGGEFLWFDESSIAALGENVLKFGYPKSMYNGVLIWSHHGYRPGDAYISRPWMEIYVSSVGFLTFGKTNFAARIFFAIFGFFSLMLTYFLSKRIFKNARPAWLLSLLLLSTSVPFLLQMRQCAYYSLVTFGTLWIIWSYLDLLEAKKYGFISFLFSSVFLILANHGFFLMVFLGCILHYIVFSRRKDIKKYIIATNLISLPIFLAVTWYFKGFSHLEALPFAQILSNVNYYIRTVNKYVLPYRFYVLIFVCIFLIKRKKIIASMQKESVPWQGFYVFGCVFAVSLVLLGFERHYFSRYIVNWIPLLTIIHAYIVARFFRWNKILGAVLLILIIFTNVLNTSGTYLLLKPIKPVLRDVFRVKKKEIDKIDKKAKIKSYFLDYIYEITHLYRGPIASIVTYLNKNAKSTDEFKTPYNVTGIMYYTGLVGSKDFSEETYPEWIIPRRDWLSSEFYDSEYYRKITQKYHPIKLNAVDIPWENRPDDLDYHKFRTLKEGPPLVIFKRKY